MVSFCVSGQFTFMQVAVVMGEDISDVFMRWSKNWGNKCSKLGCPYDNAKMESSFATLKKERIYR